MITLRIYTDADTFVDYTDLFEVDIDPASVSGATYYSQESQRARVVLPMNATLETLLDDGTVMGATVDTGIYRAYCEIWEEMTAIGYAGDDEDVNRVLFRGYLFQDSIAFKVEGVVAGEATKTATLLIYDYLAVLRKYLSRYPESPVLNNSPRTLTAGQQIVIENEIRDLWNYVSIGAAAPLWSRPQLVYDYDPYADLTYDYAHLEIFASWSDADWNYGKIYGEGDEIWFKYFGVNLVGGDLYRGKYQIWRVSGTGLINHLSVTYHSTSFSGVVSLCGVDSDYESWDEDYHHYSVSGSTAYYDIEQDDEESSLTLYANGEIQITTVNVIEDAEIDTLDWLNYLLTLQLAWFRPDGGAWVVTNKQHYSNATSAGFSADVKVTEYREDFDPHVGSYTSSYSQINASEGITEEISEYARKYHMNYPRICHFSTNERVELGDFVYLPDYNANFIHIIETSYDPRTPLLYHYKGRSA